MSSEILSRARACQDCHASKVARHVKAPLSRRSEPDCRFTSLHVDLVGPLPQSEGMRYIFTIIDRFSRWIEAIPLPTMTAADCAQALLRHWVSRYGVPSDITSDQGRQFTSDLWRDLHRSLGIKSLRTTSYHPQANGMVERLHRTVKERIMARSSTADWMTHLPFVLLGIRSAVREDSGTSPAELLYGTVLRLPGQMLPGVDHQDLRPSSEFIRDLQCKMKESVQMPVIFHGNQQTHLPAALRSASHVFVRVDAVRPPLTRPYDGPYTVLSRAEDLKTFTLDKRGTPWVVSVDRLKPAFFHSSEANGSSSSSSALDSSSPDVPLVPAAPATAPGPGPLAPDAQDAEFPLGPDVPLPAAGPVVAVDVPADVHIGVPGAVLDPVGDPAEVARPAPFVTRSGRQSQPPERFQAGS